MIKAVFSYTDEKELLEGELKFNSGMVINLDHEGIELLRNKMKWTDFDLVAANGAFIWIEQNTIGLLIRLNQSKITDEKSSVVEEIKKEYQKDIEDAQADIMHETERLVEEIVWNSKDWWWRYMALKAAMNRYEKARMAKDNFEKTLKKIWR